MTLPVVLRRALAPALVPALLLAAAPSAGAQITLTHTEDAAVVPAGALRVRVTNGWSRFDERFITGGARRSLADDFSTDSLGVAQLPGLAPVQSALQTLAADPLARLTLGRLQTFSDARIVSTPIALEFGVTRRLSVGLLVPIVQTRRTISLRVNQDSARLANAGFLPARVRGEAARANTAATEGLQRAADSLGTLLSRCPTNPAAPGCAAVNASAADASAARARALVFAQAVRTGLGAADSAQILIAPRTGSALATAIEAQRTAINAALRRFLGASAGSASPVYTTGEAFSAISLNGRGQTTGLLQSPLGGGLDSLRTAESVTIGDLALGARLVLLDRYARDTTSIGRLQLRLAVGGGIRFATGRADSARNLVDIPTSEGPGVEMNGALDVQRGRLAATVAARAFKGGTRTARAFVGGDPEAAFPIGPIATVERTGGTVLSLDLSPRYLLGDWFAFSGHYGIEATSATTYAQPDDASPIPYVAPDTRFAQRAGLGVRFSTVDAWQRQRARFPIEVSYAHLETITGSDGVARISRDQIQLRFYVQVLGR